MSKDEIMNLINEALSFGYHTAKDEAKGIPSAGYGTRFFDRYKIEQKLNIHSVSGKQFLEWININEKLPPEHDLVLTIDATGYTTLSRYVSNSFPSGAVLWAEIPFPKIACADTKGGENG